MLSYVQPWKLSPWLKRPDRLGVKPGDRIPPQLLPTNEVGPPLNAMKATTVRKPLKAVTWVMGDKPCRTFKLAAGCWTETAPARRDGKVGGPPAN